MKKAIVYTRSGRVSPSSNYRILQYIPNLKKNVVTRSLASEWLYKHHANANNKLQKAIWYLFYYGQIQLRVTKYMIMDLCNNPASIVVQRAISPKIVCFWNRVLMKKAYSKCNNLIWDFDDEIFNNHEITEFEAELLKKYAKTIIVTSDFLKSRLDTNIQNKVILMHTTDGEFATEDENEMFQLRKSTYDKQIELLWLATAPSLIHLRKIQEVLDQTAQLLKMKTGKELILHVVCNKTLEFNPKYLILDNIVWSREKALKMIKQSHIGIMPLVNTVSSKGKGGFKIIQYMSAAMPAVASAIGFNKEIVVDGQTGYLVDDISDHSGWKKAILSLSENWDVYVRMARKSKDIYNERFSYQNNLDLWEKIIDERL